MTYSQPIFNANNDINEISKGLKKSLLSLKNRLQSILHDYHFVQAVHQSLEYPLSTDGHTNVWTFSLRRLNLHLLPVIASAGGVTIVDSTRRGKLMPDALLKTIPIWCAVVNSVLYGDGDWLRTPRSMVPENEHNSIRKLIPSFVEEVKRMGLFDGCEKLEKPLVPSWYYPSSKAQTIDSAVYNVCCVSASMKVDVHKQVRVGNGVSFDYVQGSADDHELWAPPHLTPDVFWEICHNDGYITMGDSELEDAVNSYKPLGSTLETFTLGDTGITIGKIESDIPYSKLTTPTAIVFHEQHTITDTPRARPSCTAKYQAARRVQTHFEQFSQNYLWTFRAPSFATPEETSVLASPSSCCAYTLTWTGREQSALPKSPKP
ncbi:tRNA A64-2'-O-ribosylphosphate transferase [Candida viswanathii]|uniref:tRNA A64-2'-O-ribosylphosphate transferase n=1 Tax=Candida viswanathii TaxID=5486 RepID=A0A367YHG9_9ASCO|nr:tRNA A64-2'-O-ribosylphosphate transferase [Candida viswanathii]